jgi:hypothetical protein
VDLRESDDRDNLVEAWKIVSSDFSVELTDHVADLKRDLATWVKAVNALFVAKFEAKAVIIDPTSRV